MQKINPLFLFLCFTWSMVSIAMEENNYSEHNELADNFDPNHRALLRAQSEPRPTQASIKIAPRKLSEPQLPNKAPVYRPIKQCPEVMQLLLEAKAAIAKALPDLALKYKNYKKITLENKTDYIFLTKDYQKNLYMVTITKTWNPDGSTVLSASAKQIS